MMKKGTFFHKHGCWLVDKFFYNYRYRPMLNFLVQNYKHKDLVGVEIGVRQGGHALLMLNSLPNLCMLYLVDPYFIYKDYSVDKDGLVIDTSVYKSISRETLENDISNDGRYIFIYEPSENAVKDIPDDCDFCYIDGNHSYEFCRRDIELYYPKIRKGGVLGGHDYHYSGVKKAVDEFLSINEYKLFQYQEDWWIIKK